MNKNFFIAVLLAYLFTFAQISAQMEFTEHLIADKFDETMSVRAELFENKLTKNDTVRDYDGNVYGIVQIGNQLWMKENLKSLHYSDGTLILDVTAYNNSDSLAGVYGLLYTWNAAMKNATVENSQGLCPCEWHVPSDKDWKELELFLGGVSVAGGKMKSTTGWKSPNAGATNSSGFSALAAGEYDSNDLKKFQLLNEYAVFWTSTNINKTTAKERYLAYNNAASYTYNWYKIMKYSIRCVKNTATGTDSKTTTPETFYLFQNYPNPFNPTTTIEYVLPYNSRVKIEIFNMLGQLITTLIDKEESAGYKQVLWNANDLSSGIYIAQMKAEAVEGGNKFSSIRKLMLLK
ncbi:MAG: T9SS type A sorting domain-containing protein [Ignavibacteriales bacterium]|nr:T9SS type A sorting domain-containing protein [Ignavibacteriales bacterium]